MAVKRHIFCSTRNKDEQRPGEQRQDKTEKKKLLWLRLHQILTNRDAASNSVPEQGVESRHFPECGFRIHLAADSPCLKLRRAGCATCPHRVEFFFPQFGRMKLMGGIALSE